jgi:hypothetical protein
MGVTKVTSGLIESVEASKVTNLDMSFDDNDIINSISTLALRQSSNESKTNYSTNSMYVDTLNDDTGITAISTGYFYNASKYVSTELVGEAFGTLQNFTASQWTTGNLNAEVWRQLDGSAGGFRTGSFNRNGYLNTGNGPSSGPNEDAMARTVTSSFFPANTPFQFEMVGTNITENGKPTHHGPFLTFMDTANHSTLGTPTNTGPHFFGNQYGTNNSIGFNMQSGQGTNTSASGGGYFHEKQGGVAKVIFDQSTNNSIFKGQTTRITRDTGGIFRIYLNNVLQATSTYNITPAMGMTIGGTGGHGQSATGMKYSVGTAGTFGATGSFESNAITSSSSISEMGAIITYENENGTNALNTDIVLKLSANGGSSYSTATLVAMPDFATGVKMAKVNDLAVTAGTSLKYRVEFANQVFGSKKVRIRGVALQY